MELCRVNKVSIILWCGNLSTHCGLVMPYSTEIKVNIVSGYGLLPDGTNPLPETMLISH